MDILGNLLNPKVLFIIACVAIVGFVIFYMWRKNNNDLKKLKNEQLYMNKQFEHGVMLNPTDNASCMSDDTHVNLETPTPEEEDDHEQVEDDEDEDEDEDETYYLSSIPVKSTDNVDEDEAEGITVEEDASYDENLIRQIQELSQLRSDEDTKETASVFEEVTFEETKEDDVTISDEELRTKILIDIGNNDDESTTVSERKRPKIRIKKNKKNN